jgi:pilus assembly protein Flp/PilA
MLAKGTFNLCKGVVNMIKFVKSFVADESGASAAEYALILAIVGAGIAIAALALGGAIKTAISDSASCITSPGTVAAPNAKCN